MLNVVMLSVVMLNGMALTEEACSDKRSSLFDLFVSGEEKSFSTWSTGPNVIKLFLM
jgi:hypothetical protein